MDQNIVHTGQSIPIALFVGIALFLIILVGIFFAIKYLIRYHAKINEAVQRRAMKLQGIDHNKIF